MIKNDKITIMIKNGKISLMDIKGKIAIMSGKKTQEIIMINAENTN